MTGTTRFRGLTPAHLYRRLFQALGPQHWWPAETHFEVMVGAILTQNTAWSNVERAMEQLKVHRALTPRRLASLPLRRLEGWIRSSGYFRQKAARLQGFARYLMTTYGGRLAAMRGEPGAVLRAALLTVKGIGPETADSILLYALGKPVFVVDAYTRRIGQRMGFFRTDDYQTIQRFFEHRLPRRVQPYNEFHALLVALGKQFCHARAPDCQPCPAQPLCAYGRRAAAVRDGA